MIMKDTLYWNMLTQQTFTIASLTTEIREDLEILGDWLVLEYERSSARKVSTWKFRSFSEAEEFRVKRSEFYRTIGLSKRRRLTAPRPKISRAEMELFQEIVSNPRLLRRAKDQFVN